MGVSLHHLLTLAGRLDDTQGFESARERFRRFLREHVTTPAAARDLIDQAQHTPGEQHRRALQDLVAITGRFLGFDVTFGAYEPVSGALKLDGQWHTRAGLQVVLDVRSAHSPGHESIDGLVRSIAAASSVSGVRTLGVCVVTSQFSSRRRLEDAIAGVRPGAAITLLPLGSLLSMADLCAAGALSHDDVVRVIELPGADFVLDLIQRTSANTAPTPALTPSAPAVPALPVADAPSWWIASVVRDYATRPEEFLEMVVGRRQIFGIARNDWICFYLAGRGVVGRAQVASLADHKSIRDAHRYRQLLNVQDVALHLTAPIPLDPAVELRLRALAPSNPNLPVLMRITRETFKALTQPPKAAVPDAQGARERRTRHSD